jgi:hypothetical protein
MSYEFEDLNMNEIAAEAGAINKESGATDIFVKMPMADGYVLVRFLPPQKGKSLFCATRIHNLGTKRFHCLRHRKTLPNGIFWVNTTNDPGTDCPICQEYSRLWKVSNNQRGDEQIRTQSTAREIKPIERFYWNVIVRQQINEKTGSVEKNVGPKILSCGKTLQAIILESINGSELTGRKKLGNITHPVTGRDFRLVKKMTKGTSGAGYPKYDQSSFEDPSELGTDDQIRIWLESMHNLDDLRNLRPRPEMIDSLREYFNGGASEAPAFETQKVVSVSVPATPAAPAPAAKAPSKPVEPEVDDLMDDDFSKALGAING